MSAAPDIAPPAGLSKASPRAVIRQRSVSALLLVVALFVIAGIAGLIIMTVPEWSRLVYRQSLARAYAVPFTEGTLLGADQLGRPLEWRLLAGLGISLAAAAAVTLIASIIGLTMGLLGGFFGRWTDRFVTVLVDVTWAYPTLLLAVVIAGIQGPGISTVIWALGLTLWAAMARVVRAQVLSLRELEYVQAARALGYGRFYIATRHLVPNLIPTSILMATLFVALTIVAEAGLSFIGLGAQSPSPSLGKTLAEGFTFAANSPWPLLFGSATIILLVTSLNALGDRLRDVLDPKDRVPRLTSSGSLPRQSNLVSTPAAETASADTLTIDNVRVAIDKDTSHDIDVITGVTLRVGQADTVGIVGESGSGKSVAARAMTGLLPAGLKLADGRVFWNGKDIAQFSRAGLRDQRGRVVGMVFQDARASLDPLYTVGQSITEVLRAHAPGSTAELKTRVVEMLARVGLSDPAMYYDRYPHELSGGQLQRAGLAGALILQPQVLLADEPTTGLDATTQKNIVALVKDLQREMKMTIVWISHDLDLVAQVAERIVVMYAGQVVETGWTDEVLSNPRHPYTLGLLNSRPNLAVPRKAELSSVPGNVPEPGAWPPACHFAPRCSRAIEICHRTPPELEGASAIGRSVRCHNPVPLAIESRSDV